MGSPALELVVARHRERVEWTRNVPRTVRVSIYDKGGDLDERRFAVAARLENVGREAETYLRHILGRWDELADLTVFCQGHPFDHASDLHRVLADLAAGRTRVADFRWLGFIIDTDDPRGRRLFVPWSKNEDGRELAVDRFHALLFGAPPPPLLRFYPGGQFVVTSACVRARPRTFSARALELAAGFPDGAHCFERVWDRIFGVSGVDPALLGDAPCRYLKPVRREIIK